MEEKSHWSMVRVNEPMDCDDRESMLNEFMGDRPNCKRSIPIILLDFA